MVRSHLRDKCSGSTAGSNPARQGSTPWSRARLKRESEGLGGGLQNRITQFNSAALLQTVRKGGGQFAPLAGDRLVADRVADSFTQRWWLWCSGPARFAVTE